MTSTFPPAFAWRAARFAAVAFIALLCGANGCGDEIARSAPTPPATNNGETIVMVRHGEIPEHGLGQLDCRGLNRSLALPKVLIDRFGRADAIFAPDPADQIQEGRPRLSYSYVRPLATIEPTAIELGLPVSTQLSYQDVTDLQSTVTAPAYAKSIVFIAWEHQYAHLFAQQMLSSYGQDPSTVPPWPSNDFEMIYVFHITPPATGTTGLGALTFQVQQEGLTDSLSNTCPDSSTIAR